jgi:hypothetical protein
VPPILVARRASLLAKERHHPDSRLGNGEKTAKGWEVAAIFVKVKPYLASLIRRETAVTGKNR